MASSLKSSYLFPVPLTYELLPKRLPQRVNEPDAEVVAEVGDEHLPESQRLHRLQHGHAVVVVDGASLLQLIVD